MVKPTNITLTFKEHKERNMTTIKQVYNARIVNRSSQRGFRTKMQHLINLFEQDMYIHCHRTNDTSEVVHNIFWTHPDVVRMINAFNMMFSMDSTYKTNIYRQPLLEIMV